MGRIGIQEILIIIIPLIIYFIPSIVGRKQRNFNSILLLNIFLGWSIIGWVVALIWAVSKEKKETLIVNSSQSVSDELQKLKQLYDNGTLTAEEFETEKKHVLKK